MGILELRAMGPLAKGDGVAVSADSGHLYAGMTGTVERLFTEGPLGDVTGRREYLVAYVELDNGAATCVLATMLERLPADGH
jgi:hypothetical protein